MKKNQRRGLKLLGLTMLLALCLLLTGCVVPPEDIGTNGGYVVTDNDLPFQSLGPKITATPYTPPTNSPTPTASPTPNPYLPQNNQLPVFTNNAITTNPPSSTTQQGANVILPVVSVTTNPVTTSTLKNGATGSDVKKMQERLKELGYLKGTADGDFGTATETAVKNFQAQNGLTVDGVAGSATLTRLYSATARKAPTTTTNTNTPRPTNTPFTSYKKGDTGAEISKLQRRLKELGYLTGNVDGDFGEATEQAVKAFQRNNGLTADGKAGSYTLDKLYSTSAQHAPATATPFTSYKKGDTGTEITKLQRRLKELGYLSGNADGDFGDATEQAVKAFQARNGLTADGKAGERTLDKLYSDSARYAVATATPTPKPTKTPTPTATPRADSLDYYLRVGSSGAKVRTLQNRLIQLGWLSGTANGTYNNATEYAVKAFQARYASLWTDGIAGPDTLKLMYGSGAATTKTPVSIIGGATLEEGAQGDAVKAIQQRLRELGYLKATATGNFGTATKAAVIAFQTANGLNNAGIVGSVTIDKLFSADAKDSKTFSEEQKDTESAGKDDEFKPQDPEDVTDIEVGGYTTLRKGSQGEAVKKLQQALKNRGYYAGNVDGSYSTTVVSAVKAYQKASGLKADGVAGPATQAKLYGSSASNADTAGSLKKGAYGPQVRNLQYVLYELGYYDGSIDGDYGDTTEDAVRAFQINNSLTPVDGVAGTKTLKQLYSGQAIGATASSGAFETLKQGDKGTLVVEMQEVLASLGYLVEVTGVYDNATVTAVKNFQTRNGLAVDGKAGQDTLTVLYSKNARPAW